MIDPRATGRFVARCAAIAFVVALGSLALSDEAQALDPCPPDVALELSNVPSFLPWGSRRTIYVDESWGASDAYFESQTVSWKNGRVFAHDNYGTFDFWIGAAHGEPAPSFIVSWTASYYDGDWNEHFCEGSTGVIEVATGLDRRIVVNQSIAGVALGERRSRVVEALGAAGDTFRKFGGAILVWAYPGRRVGVWFYRTRSGVWRVHSVYTRSSTFRTGKDAGVGTTLRALKRKHSAVRCYSAQDWHECWIRRLAPQGSTIFSLRDRRVYEIKVTYIGD